MTGSNGMKCMSRCCISITRSDKVKAQLSSNQLFSRWQDPEDSQKESAIPLPFSVLVIAITNSFEERNHCQEQPEGYLMQHKRSRE